MNEAAQAAQAAQATTAARTAAGSAPGGGAAALRLSEVRKSFGKTEIIRGVDLEVPVGERHALIGPNGAGKSTLFHLISARLAVSSGSIELKGQPITGLPPYRINRMGLSRSFQITNIFPRLSVFENIRCATLYALGYRYSFWHRLSRLRDAADLVKNARGITGRIRLAAPEHRSILLADGNDRCSLRSGVHDHAVAKYERRFTQPPSDVAATELLQHVHLPDDLSSARVHRRKVPAGAERVHLRSVDRGCAAGAVPLVGAEPIAVRHLPQLLSRRLIEGHHVLGAATRTHGVELARGDGKG